MADSSGHASGVLGVALVAMRGQAGAARARCIVTIEDSPVARSAHRVGKALDTLGDTGVESVGHAALDEGESAIARAARLVVERAMRSDLESRLASWRDAVGARRAHHRTLRTNQQATITGGMTQRACRRAKAARTTAARRGASDSWVGRRRACCSRLRRARRLRC